ncbi:MAG: cardiolipin synthase ClsB [Casimicrobiaceae bacterium]|nr:cardiolipin synthase ClsB [Casimicrobiaceae bacterium]
MMAGRRPPETGHRAELLESGAEYFPALLRAIDAAQHELLLETYIYADDPSGRAVTEALLRAAARGVRVVALIDGFGASGHIGTLAERLRSGGVALRFYRPIRALAHLRFARLQRLHRKLLTVDGRLAFIGGINIHDDANLTDPRLQGRYDFAVAITGPLVRPLRAAQRKLMGRALRRRVPPQLPSAAGEPPWLASWERLKRVARARLVLRDNFLHRHAIERAYLEAIDRARSQIWIANAYFIPGRRLLQALARARARGVAVRLMLQGHPEYWFVREAERALYDLLLAQGIELLEYRRGFLHAKVAVIDARWATVGSSNLDPFSLLLSHEANVVIEDEAFAAELRERLERAAREHGHRVTPVQWSRQRGWLRLRARLVYALTRLALRLIGFARY